MESESEFLSVSSYEKLLSSAVFFSSAVLAILPVVKQCIDFFTNSYKKKLMVILGLIL